MREINVLVIGDSCTDIFIYGDINRISPEAPVPVINPTHQTRNGGMAKNVAENLKALGATCKLITNDNSMEKKRYVDNKSNQMVLRVDEHDYADPISERVVSGINGNTYNNEQFDAVVISDYNKGFLSESNIEDLCNSNTVFLDTKKRLNGWSLFAEFIKINELEYKKNYEFFAFAFGYESRLIITEGKQGCTYMGESFPVEEVPVKDVSGAGDTFLSGLVVKYIENKDIREAIKFAQECTTKVVQKHGVSTV